MLTVRNLQWVYRQLTQSIEHPIVSRESDRVKRERNPTAH